MRKSWIVTALLLLAPLAWADKGDNNRGYLGVELQFTESIHKDGAPVQEGVGVFLSNVLSGGPAELAGLRAEDRVVAVDGHQIHGMVDLKKAMIGTREGDRVSVTVERDDREQTFDVVLGELPQRHTKVERFGVLLEQAEDRAFVGIESQPVDDQLAEYFGVEGGILVTRVVEGSRSGSYRPTTWRTTERIWGVHRLSPAAMPTRLSCGARVVAPGTKFSHHKTVDHTGKPRVSA